jgi:hypothetical protein
LREAETGREQGGGDAGQEDGRRQVAQGRRTSDQKEDRNRKEGKSQEKTDDR